VPALTFEPSASLALANALASCSLRKVARACERFPTVILRKFRKRPFLTRRSGSWSFKGPIPGQEFIEPGHWMAAGHAFQHVLEVGEGLDVIEFCSGDEGTDRRPAGRAAVGSCEEVVLASERDRADGAFDGVGVEFDAAVIEEATKVAPAGQGIADGIGQAAARRDIRLAGCWAHARRKFYEVQQATGSPIATEALRRIAELYAIEAGIRGQTATVGGGAACAQAAGVRL
jgi:hypothetical protein